MAKPLARAAGVRGVADLDLDLDLGLAGAFLALAGAFLAGAFLALLAGALFLDADLDLEAAFLRAIIN